MNDFISNLRKIMKLSLIVALMCFTSCGDGKDKKKKDTTQNSNQNGSNNNTKGSDTDNSQGNGTDDADDTEELDRAAANVKSKLEKLFPNVDKSRFDVEYLGGEENIKAIDKIDTDNDDFEGQMKKELLLTRVKPVKRFSSLTGRGNTKTEYKRSLLYVIGKLVNAKNDKDKEDRQDQLGKALAKYEESE